MTRRAGLLRLHWPLAALLAVAAWAESATASVGWPAVKVAEVEAGTADPWLALVGED